MADQEKAATATAARTKEKAAVPHLSAAEIQDQLDRFDGFDELLAPLAENLDRFSPDRPASRTRKYLQDDDLIEDRQNLKDRLEAYITFLSAKDVEGHKQIRSTAQAKLDTNEALINDNVSTILKEAKELERTYRELDLFYKNAKPLDAKNVTLVTAHPDVLLDADSKTIYNLVEKRITTESRGVDQKKAFSMLVIPNLWKSKRPKDLVEQYTKLAGEARMSFLTDFADTESVEDTLEEREAKRWQGFTGPEAFHSKLIMFANHLVLRGKHPGLDEEEDMHGSPAMAVAGKMYSEKVSQPVMGEMNGAISGTQGLAFRTVPTEIGDMADAGMNGLMNAYEKDMVYDSCTGFTGAEYALKRYPIVRTFDYVNRVLRHYLGKVTGQQLDRKRANAVRDTVQDFLDQLAEQKIINKGSVTYFDWNSRVPDRIDINIDIVPLWAVRTFVYALQAKNQESTSELKDVK